MDPKTFSSINSINVFPNGDLETICELAGVERKIFCKELKQFAGQFESFQPSMASESKLNENSIINDSEDEDNTELVDCDKCNKCIACAYIIIKELSFHSNSFHSLFTVYKYVLLLPSTQVTCKREFSKLKLVKSKIRSTTFITFNAYGD